MTEVQAPFGAESAELCALRRRVRAAETVASAAAQVVSCPDLCEALEALQLAAVTGSRAALDELGAELHRGPDGFHAALRLFHLLGEAVGCWEHARIGAAGPGPGRRGANAMRESGRGGESGTAPGAPDSAGGQA